MVLGWFLVGSFLYIEGVTVSVTGGGYCFGYLFGYRFGNGYWFGYLFSYCFGNGYWFGNLYLIRKSNALTIWPNIILNFTKITILA